MGSFTARVVETLRKRWQRAISTLTTLVTTFSTRLGWKSHTLRELADGAQAEDEGEKDEAHACTDAVAHAYSEELPGSDQAKGTGVGESEHGEAVAGDGIPVGDVVAKESDPWKEKFGGPTPKTSDYEEPEDPWKGEFGKTGKVGEPYTGDAPPDVVADTTPEPTPAPAPEPEPTRPEQYVTRKNRIPVVPVSDYGDAFDDGMAFAMAYETRGDIANGAIHEIDGDSGGLTKYGVAQNYNRDVDVENLTLDGAIDIYRKKYWPPVEQSIPASAPHLRSVYFDGYMNMGRGAMRALQRSIGVNTSSLWNDETSMALNDALDEHGEEKVIRDYLWQRREAYRGIARRNPEKRKFLKGWENRLDDVASYYDDVLKVRS